MRSLSGHRFLVALLHEGVGCSMSRKSRKRPRIALIVLAVLIVLGAIAVWRVLDRLPATAVAELERSLPFIAEVEAADFSWPGTVTLRNVTLSRKTDRSQIAAINRIECRSSLRELLAARLRIDSLLIDGVVLSLRESDKSVQGGHGGSLPDYPIQVRGLSAYIRKGEGAGAGSWPSISGVAFTLEPQASGCLALEGSGDSAAMERFRITGVLGGSLLDSRISVTFPRVTLEPGVRSMLPEQATAAWAKLAPSGVASLSGELSWTSNSTGAGAQFGLKWRLSVNGAAFRPPGLLDPITDVSAVVEGTADDFTIVQAAGRYRSARLTGRGHSSRRTAALGARLIANVRDLEPTAEIVALFPKNARTAIEDLHIDGGKLDVDVELELTAAGDPRTNGQLSPDFVRANISFRDCSAKPRWFPYRLTRTTGTISIGPEEMIITSPITGWHGGGMIRFTGTVGLVDNGHGSDLVVEANDILVDKELNDAIAAVRGNVGSVWRRLSVQGGELDAVFTWNGLFGRSANARTTLRIAADGCSASFDALPYRVTGLTGQVDVHSDKVTIKDLTGWHGGATLRLSGWLDTRTDHDDLSIEIRGSNVALDTDLAAALDPEARKLWDAAEPAGVADLTVILSPPTIKGAGPDMRVNAMLKDCSARVPVADKWLPLTAITGHLESFGDVFRATALSARCLGGSLTANGLLIRSEQLTKIKGELTGSNFSIAELIPILPPETAEQVRRLDPSGKLDIRKLSLDVIKQQGQSPDLQYAATLSLHDARLSIPMSAGDDNGNKTASPLFLSEIAGTLNIENQRGHVTTGSFELDKVRVDKGTMSNVVGNFKRTGPMFAIEDIRGDMYGGHIEAAFKGATDLLFFSGHARAAGMDVARLCRETGLTDQPVWGELRGTTQFNAERVMHGAKDATWRLSGSGAVHIDRADLGSTPLLKSVLDYKTFLMGGQSVIESASLEFGIGFRKLTIDNLLLTGPTLRARGVGSVEYGKDSKLDMYFYRKAKGSLLPNIPVIDLLGRGLNWVVDRIQNQIVVVRVTGTLRDPVVSAALLKDIGETLRRSIVFGVWEEQKEETDTTP